MIRIEIKEIETPPEPLARVGAYQKVNRACENEDGKVFNGNHYKHDIVRDKLKAISLHKENLEEGDSPKCFYCESKIEHAAKLQVEHYRPKALVDTKDTNGDVHPGYYWLGLEWSNLLLACPNCNGKSAKGNRFPLIEFENRASAINPIVNDGQELTYNRDECLADSDVLINEEPLLLNPEIDNPVDHLTFDSLGQISGTDLKGETSVEIYDLQRDLLKAHRQGILTPIIANINLGIAGHLIGRVNNDALDFYLESDCRNVKSLDDPQGEYCLWGRYINDHFEECVVANVDEEYRERLRVAYQKINNE